MKNKTLIAFLIFAGIYCGALTYYCSTLLMQMSEIEQRGYNSLTPENQDVIEYVIFGESQL